MPVSYQGPELYERVMVRKISNGEGISQGTIPIEVDGIFLNAGIGEDGVVHLDLDDIDEAVAKTKEAIEAQQAEMKSGPPEDDDPKPPNRAARRALNAVPAKKAAPRKR